MRAAMRYSFDSCSRTFYRGYGLFLSKILPSSSPTLAARVRRNVKDLVI